MDGEAVCRYIRTMARRKTKAERKEDLVRLRVTREQKDLLVAAATRAGLELSAWLRLIGLREARKSESVA